MFESVEGANTRIQDVSPSASEVRRRILGPVWRKLSRQWRQKRKRLCYLSEPRTQRRLVDSFQLPFFLLLAAFSWVTMLLPDALILDLIMRITPFITRWELVCHVHYKRTLEIPFFGLWLVQKTHNIDSTNRWLEFSRALGNSTLGFYLPVIFPLDATNAVIIVSKCILWLRWSNYADVYRGPPAYPHLSLWRCSVSGVYRREPRAMKVPLFYAFDERSDLLARLKFCSYNRKCSCTRLRKVPPFPRSLSRKWKSQWEKNWW